MALLGSLARGAALAALLAVGSVPAAAGWSQDTLENDVKAAFLYNFTKFIEWPSLPAAPEPFRICVVADEVFSRAVDRIIEGESVEGRRLVRVEPQSAQDARGCQILYVGQSGAVPGLRLAAAVQQAPVLAVSDVPGFIDQGGGIGFVLENNRVRFDVSVTALHRSGLRVSSKLLRVARHVGDTEATR